MRNQVRLALVGSFVFLLLASGLRGDEPAERKVTQLEPTKASEFVNPIGEGADPWVIRDPNDDRYLWCMSHGNHSIAIHTSTRLTSMGKRHIVWSAPATGPYSREVWAPELHFLDDRWHIYFAASDGKNENHLTYVLKSKTADPLGPYDLHGPLATGDGADGKSPNIWAIDMTVLQVDGERYALWSGWDAAGTDQQFLYIAPMKSPIELGGPRVQLCANDDHLWERVEPDASKRGLNEAPQVFQSKDKTTVVYSCGASWLPTYKLGTLELVGQNPLDPKSWRKRAAPVFQGTKNVYGVGHSCFVRSPEDRQWWHVFHAKRDRSPGWRRAIHVQPMKVVDGMPVLGRPIDAGKQLSVPDGETTTSAMLPIKLFSKQPDVATWSYYGHHQFMTSAKDRLQLGCIPNRPINDYRSGEKIVLDQTVTQNIKASVTIDFLGEANSRDAGILFRCSRASVGYDAQRGYFAGLIPRTGLVIVGKTDGVNWTEVARAKTTIDVSKPQLLSIQLVDNHITVLHNKVPRVAVTDGTYTQGSVGLRVVDTCVHFTNFVVTPSND